MPSRLSNVRRLHARPSKTLLRYILAAILLLVFVGLLRLSSLSWSASRLRFFGVFQPKDAGPIKSQKIIEPAAAQHPIDLLIHEAEEGFSNLLAKETKDFSSTAARYRKLRGRHPPPGFEAWWKYAQERDAVLVEEFFDQIYHDLNPFWGIDATQIRREAYDFEHKITIHNHSANTESGRPWMKLWLDLVKSLEQFLPDMDLAINVMDEPRLVVPWEKISELMESENNSRTFTPLSEALSEISNLVNHTEGSNSKSSVEWNDSGLYFDIARRGCHPTSPARLAEPVKDWSRDAKIFLRFATQHMHRGFVSNWTRAKSICHQPDLQSLHGAFIEPLSISSSDHLMPLFGGSKLATNNEILLPPAMYWSDDQRYSGSSFQEHSWEEKQDMAIWRGAATGGRNKIDTWTGFQRHRLASMMNGTQVSRAENWTEIPRTFELPPRSYGLTSAENGRLGEWITKICDAGFMDLLCWPEEPDLNCRYTEKFYALTKPLPMAQQFRYKYLPDVDGNSFSGRYRGFLRSNSLPIKATLFNEWHDSRLVAWIHFVPMDNRFVDFYGILEYFLGYPGISEDDPDTIVPGHDEAAKRIALAGEEWAKKVLRPEDMQIYVFRLLLEYARVSADHRHRLAYVDDLKGSV